MEFQKQTESWNDKVSVIVPVHNAGKTIKKTIDAILDQKCSIPIELILIENGSTDESQNICEQYAKRCPDVIVKSYGQMSPGAARNKGLDEAHGKYIWFVDSDDKPKRDMLNALLSGMNDCEQVICGFEGVKAGEVQYRVSFFQSGEYGINDILYDLLLKDTNIYYGAVWNKLYLNDVIKNSYIRFDEDTYMAEDLLFNYKYWSETKKVRICASCLYQYEISNRQSLSVKKREAQNYWENEKRLYSGIVKLLCKKQMKDNDCKAICYRYGMYLKRRAIYGILANYRDMPGKEKRRLISGILKDRDIKESAKNYFRASDWCVYLAEKTGCTSLLIGIMDLNIARKERAF